MTGAGPIRVGIADDDDLVGAGVGAVLDSDPGIVTVSRAADGDEAVAMVQAHLLDVVLLDVRMPRVDGITALERIRALPRSPAAAVLTTFGDAEYIEGAVAAGTDGFLLKSDAPQDLIRSVHALAGGGAAFSPRVARWLLRSRTHRNGVGGGAVLDRLSARQRDLLAMLPSGASNAEIADALHLTEGTVKQYLRDIFGIIGATNRVQAAIFAHEAGLGRDG